MNCLMPLGLEARVRVRVKVSWNWGLSTPPETVCRELLNAVIVFKIGLFFLK